MTRPTPAKAIYPTKTPRQHQQPLLASSSDANNLSDNRSDQEEEEATITVDPTPSFYRQTISVWDSLFRKNADVLGAVLVSTTTKWVLGFGAVVWGVHYCWIHLHESRDDKNGTSAIFSLRLILRNLKESWESRRLTRRVSRILRQDINNAGWTDDDRHVIALYHAERTIQRLASVTKAVQDRLDRGNRKRPDGSTSARGQRHVDRKALVQGLSHRIYNRLLLPNSPAGDHESTSQRELAHLLLNESALRELFKESLKDAIVAVVDSTAVVIEARLR